MVLSGDKETRRQGDKETTDGAAVSLSPCLLVSLSPPRLLWRQYRLPRQGYSSEECQDASAGDQERGRFAVADGASEGSFSYLWAQLLVEDFVRTQDPRGGWTERLPPLQQRWAAAVCP